MQDLFTALSRAIDGAPLIALTASFIWGVCSVILSPCHLASIPLIVGFIDEQGCKTARRAFVASSLFAVGILLTIAIIGVVTALMGRMLGDIGNAGNWLLAITFLVVGLHLLEAIPLPWSGPGNTGMKKKGLMAAFLLGLIFGIALGPCTFAYMAPMLGMTFKLGAERPVYAATLLLVYGIGHCSVIVFAGTFTEVIQAYLNWNENSNGAIILKKVCGALVVLAGLYMVYLAV